MVNRAGLQADPPSNAETGITAERLIAWRGRSRRWQAEGLVQILASFTSMTGVTIIAGDCYSARGIQTLVTHDAGLPSTAVAFCLGVSSILQGKPTMDFSPNSSVSKRVAALTRRLGLGFSGVRTLVSYISAMGDEPGRTGCHHPSYR
jgi:hypothetical protein